MGISLLFVVCLIATPALGSSSPKKRSKSDRDIGAIGHRKINVPTLDSSEREKQIGAQWSASFERSTSLLRDPTISAYVGWLAHTVAQNSDAQQIPITVRIIDSEDVKASTFPGGYQYISRGLLLRIRNEGELASVLARGIAHTALHSAIREFSKEAIAKIATTPLIFGPSDKNTPPSSSTVRWLLKTKWEDEFDADYFGLQYLYKSGYDPECFLSFVQTAWPTDPSEKPAAAALNQFPPPPERLKALQEEINDVLPKRNGMVTNTPEFADFREHLLKLSSPNSETKSESKPMPTPP
jgi:beta-barrel assembly-enhancing protease